MVDLLGEFIKRTPPFKGKWRFRERWLRTRRPGDVRLAEVGPGVRMRLDLRVPYEAMVWLRQEEPGDLDRLRELLRAGRGLFVDAGANVGLWTLTAARELGDDGKVMAFEPNPATFKKLSENIAVNRFETRVQTRQVALSASRGSVNFLCREDHNNSRIAAAGEVDAAVAVPTGPLVDFVGDADVQGMKVDVEGHELAVLEAARPVLERCLPWLVVEFNTLAAGTNRLGHWPVFQFLNGMGYAAHAMEDRASANELSPDASFTGYLNILFRARVRGTN